MTKEKTKKDNSKTILDKVRIATILGTFQATLTNFNYLRKRWKDTTEEERLLKIKRGKRTRTRLKQDDTEATLGIKVLLG